MNIIAIIVAGGQGVRFGGPLPKQFLPLAGRPVLMHTIDAFSHIAREILVVLPEANFDTWRQLRLQHGFTTPHRIVEGGGTRFQSVKNALDTLDSDSGTLVAVHDGVRPLVDDALISRTVTAAMTHGAAVPVVPVTDSIRQMDDDGHAHPLVRSTLRAVQTPQCFRLDALKHAYALPEDDTITDDAMTYERLGKVVALVDGDPRNIKITRSADLAIAEMLMHHG